jgi:uncharacterized membrane protein
LEVMPGRISDFGTTLATLDRSRGDLMRSRAWAWLLALVALVLAVIPMAGMAGILGLEPMSIAVSNTLWLTALVLTIVSFVMSIRQGTRTRA